MPFFTAAQVAALSRAAWLAELQFKSGTSRVWAGDTILDVGGHEWLPTKGQVQIEGLGITGEPVSRQITFTVPGVSGDILAAAIAETEEADQQPLILYLQTFDDDWQPTGALIPLFYGLMQPPRISRTAATGEQGAVQSISLSAENAFFNRAKPANGRYTSLDQNKRTAVQDDFFDFVPSLFNKQFVYPDF